MKGFNSSYFTQVIMFPPEVKGSKIKIPGVSKLPPI